MRIYLPLTAADRAHLAQTPAGAARVLLPLERGRRAWAVTEGVLGDQVGADMEDLEYEAMQEAVHVAMTAALAAGQDGRLIVVAGDSPENAWTEDAAVGGAYGLRLQRDEALALASVHVTELTARAVDADDTDPALLWFDVAEVPAALDYAEHRRGA